MIFQGNEVLQKLRSLNYMRMAASSSNENGCIFVPNLSVKASTYREGSVVSIIKNVLASVEMENSDGPLVEVTDWGWKFENGAVLKMTDQVISFHYSRHRGAILFLLFYGSPCIIIIGRGIVLFLFYETHCILIIE